MQAPEVDMKAGLILAGLKGAWYEEKEHPSTEALLFAVQNQMGPLTVGILLRDYGCKFPPHGSEVMTAIVAYTQRYGVNILMEMCKKRYSGANSKIKAKGGGTALHVVCANAATLLTTTPTAINPSTDDVTDPRYPSQVYVEVDF